MARKTRKSDANKALAVGYVRVSTEDQNLGPDAQRKAIELWARANGVRVAVVFEDLGISGGAALDRRPGLLAAVEALSTLGAGVLLVAKRDRLARDVMNAAMVERLAERAGARVLSADGTGNGDGDGDFLIRGMMDLFAQYERLVIRSRTKAALAVKKARGERTGGIRYGWTLAEDGKTLLPNEAELEVIRRIHALRAEGLSLRAIATRLEAVGVTTRAGGRWAPQTLAQVLDRATA